MTLIERTIKIVLATTISILIAEALTLSYASSAGIIAILSVLETRISSLKTASQRLQSIVLAFSIAVLCYSFIGFNLLAFSIYLTVYVLLAYFWKIEAGVAPSTVLVTHFLAEKNITPSFIFNEFILFAIGVGVALLFNTYMSSKEKEIQAFHGQVEEQLKLILYRFEDLLLQGSGINDAKLIIELDEVLKRAIEVVYLDRYNQVFQRTNYQVHYFEMRQQQNKLLRQMATNINRCYLDSPENILLAHLFHETASQLSLKNPAITLIDDIEQMLVTFRGRNLPRSREEFETRAILFQLLRDLERFIQLKVDFYQTYKEYS